MASLMVVFMINGLHFDDQHANLTWGAIAALIYITPVLGGWLGDRVLGTRRTMLLGVAVLLIGYVLLALPMNGQTDLFLSLSVVIIGGGLFKPTAGNMVRLIYKNEPHRLDSAFTLYYMAVNIGGTVSMLLAPYLKEKYGWHAAFALCALGMVMAILQAILASKYLKNLGTALDNQPFKWKRFFGVIIGTLVLIAVMMPILMDPSVAKICVVVIAIVTALLLLYMIFKAKSGERKGLIVACILILEMVLFMIFYQQMTTSLTLFALRNVDNHFTFFGLHLFTFSAPQYMSLNGIWIFVLSPLLAWIYNKYDHKAGNASVAQKYALGFAAVALGFGIFTLSGNFAVDGKISSWFMVAGYGFYSLGELLVNGLGMSMISKFAPPTLSATLMGVYFLAAGIAQYMGSIVANLAKMPHDVVLSAQQTLPLYINLFKTLTWMAIAGLIVALILLPLINRLIRAHAVTTSA
uniref:Slc15a-9 n=1 Tax=Schmidtea mediterranea TaxID=79327 RepID=A0A0H3YF03_SCHMD|nr:slc15a-9 [Schmidtea mediterranea]